MSGSVEVLYCGLLRGRDIGTTGGLVRRRVGGCSRDRQRVLVILLGRRLIEGPGRP